MSDLSEKERDNLIAMLFGSALSSREVDWEEAPTLMAKLERAGFVVRGDYSSDDYRKTPVISVELKLRVRWNTKT